ncbi:MAG: hypothetical protein FWF46_08050 [Oscillospiraceae bacterium]|nr:hypothetical protein [Oscillospiraceae bacterium]
MSQIEREIKILNIDVPIVIEKLVKLDAVLKGKYIQDLYTFDFPKLEDSYKQHLREANETSDNRALISLLKDIKACFTQEDVLVFDRLFDGKDIIDYVKTASDYSNLSSNEIVEVLSRVNEDYSKWIRLRQTGNETTLTIKKIVNNKGEYDLDAVREVEFVVPSIEVGKEFLANMGYFPNFHQKKMRIAYDYKGTEVVLDKWPKIPPYIEVEGHTKEEICTVVNDLGFTATDMRVMNTDQVFVENGLDLYSFKDLDFSEDEEKEVQVYMEIGENQVDNSKKR